VAYVAIGALIATLIIGPARGRVVDFVAPAAETEVPVPDPEVGFIPGVTPPPTPAPGIVVPEPGPDGSQEPLDPNGDVVKKYEASVRAYWALSPEQRKLTKRVIARDKLFRKLVGDSPYKITQLGPWTMSKDPHKFIGAFAIIRTEGLLSQRNLALPQLTFNPDKQAYDPGTLYLKKWRAREIKVLVSFVQRRAVAFPQVPSWRATLDPKTKRVKPLEVTIPAPTDRGEVTPPPPQSLLDARRRGR
jgi:hypothetical protein